jgi:hypothetical protein
MTPWMTKPWTDATAAALESVPVSTGVFEIRSGTGEVLDISYAGAREPFGLRSALQRVVGELSEAGLQFRYEQHVQYHSRYLELVLSHRSRHQGQSPRRVAERSPGVHGRLSVGNQKE